MARGSLVLTFKNDISSSWSLDSNKEADTGYKDFYALEHHYEVYDCPKVKDLFDTDDDMVPSDGEALVWSDAVKKWISSVPPGGGLPGALDGAEHGDTLVYSEITGAWEVSDGCKKEGKQLFFLAGSAMVILDDQNNVNRFLTDFIAYFNSFAGITSDNSANTFVIDSEETYSYMGNHIPSGSPFPNRILYSSNLAKWQKYGLNNIDDIVGFTSFRIGSIVEFDGGLYVGGSNDMAEQYHLARCIAPTDTWTGVNTSVDPDETLGAPILRKNVADTVLYMAYTYAIIGVGASTGLVIKSFSAFGAGAVTEYTMDLGAGTNITLNDFVIDKDGNGFISVLENAVAKIYKFDITNITGTFTEIYLPATEIIKFSYSPELDVLVGLSASLKSVYHTIDKGVTWNTKVVHNVAWVTPEIDVIWTGGRFVAITKQITNTNMVMESCDGWKWSEIPSDGGYIIGEETVSTYGMECVIAHKIPNAYKMWDLIDVDDNLDPENFTNPVLRFDVIEQHWKCTSDGLYGAWAPPTLPPPHDGKVFIPNYNTISTTTMGLIWDPAVSEAGYTLSTSDIAIVPSLNKAAFAPGLSNGSGVITSSANNICLTSADMVNWTSFDPLATVPYLYTGMIANSGSMVAGFVGSTFKYSTDAGNTFTDIAFPTANNGWLLRYENNQWIAGTRITSEYTHLCKVSDNGIQWTNCLDRQATADWLLGQVIGDYVNGSTVIVASIVGFTSDEEGYMYFGLLIYYLNQYHRFIVRTNNLTNLASLEIRSYFGTASTNPANGILGYGNGVLTSANGYYSTDKGLTWLAHGILLGTPTYAWQYIPWTGNKFVIQEPNTSTDVKIKWSYDGISWASSTLYGSYTIDAIETNPYVYTNPLIPLIWPQFN